MEVAGALQTGGIQGINPVDKSEVTEETFLRLLTTQLQHQDPLKPASDVEFIQQMATFASLEQQRATNTNLNVIQLYQNSLNNSNALGIVGKDVKVQDRSISHQEGESHSFLYESDSQANNVEFEILDEDGDSVYKYTQLGAEDGERAFTWYGVDNDGNQVPPGDYSIHINLLDEDGKKFPSQVFQSKNIKGVSYENGGIMVLIDGRKVPIDQVVEVYASGHVSQEEPQPDLGTGGGHRNKQFPFKVIKGGI